MKKQLLKSMRMLLAVALLGVGVNGAWGAAALTSSFTVTGYEYAHLIDFQNKAYDGTAFSTMEELGTTFGVTSQQTIQTSYASSVWYDDTSNSRGLRHNGGGNRWITFPISIKANDYIIVNGAAASETYEISMTNGSSVSVAEASDYLCFKASADGASITLNVHRYNYLLQVLVMTPDASAETADYTINYKAGGVTVKTVSETSVAVGTEIPVLSSFIEGGKKYTTDGGQPSSLTVEAGGSTLNINVTEAPQYTCTINAKSGATVLASPNNTVYSGEDLKVFYKKAYKNGGVWYVTPANGSYPSYAHTFSNVTTDVSFDVSTYEAKENIVYYGEVEEMNLSGSFAANGGQTDRYSNGVAKRLYSGGGATPSSGSWVYTDDIVAGVYTVTLWARNQSGTQTATLPVYLRDSDGNMTDLSTSFEAWAKSAQGEKSVDVTIPDDGKTYSIAIYNFTGYNSNLEMDYVYVTKKTVSKSISAAGWATYCSPYALDLENATGLTDAYIVTGGAAGVLSKTSVKGGTVAANTGLLLKAAEGTVTIPVVATGTDYSTTNKLVGVTVATEKAQNTAYVLMNDATNGLGFYLNSNETAFTVGANTAYLPANFTGSGARGFFLLDGSDATGIGTALMNKEAMNSEVYNLQGQRVAAPTKGLYIVNGKKAIVK